MHGGVAGYALQSDWRFEAMRYSALKILSQGLSGNRGWKPWWREPEPKAAYDVVIVGGRGHGLATGYYLATR